MDLALSTGSTPRIVVVRGLGGQGKTQVALEYCHRAKETGIRAILWIDATSQVTVEKTFETISESIKKPGDIIQDNASVRFVMVTLEA